MKKNNAVESTGICAFRLIQLFFLMQLKLQLPLQLLVVLPHPVSCFTGTSSFQSSHRRRSSASASGSGSGSILVIPSSFHKSWERSTTKQQPLLKQSAKLSQTSLSMHVGGHSHSHSHENAAAPTVTASQNVAATNRRRRRLYAMVLFCAAVILGPPLLLRKAVAQRDAAAFSITCIALSLLEPMRLQVQSFLTKLSQLGHGIAKHSTPLTARYFFKNESAADRVTLLGGVVNIILSAGKFFVGVHCHSSALIADAGHSLSDLFSDFVTLWAVQVGRLPPDEDHPYGHGKFEAIGSLFLSLTLFGTGIGVGIMSNRKLLEILALQKSGAIAASAVPGIPALVMAGVSVLSKEWLFRVTASVGQRLNSQIVLANAWHHRSDAYSSILALVSIGLARFSGLIAADAVAGLLVAGMICMTGAEIMGESIKQLTDTSHVELVQTVTALALSVMPDDVERVLSVKARHMGSSSTVDVSVAMPSDRTASAARAVEARLKQSILEHYNGINDSDSNMHVEVRATSPGMTCPLLTAPTAAQVEESVRTKLATSVHNKLVTVQDVTVHYPDPLLVDVDVDITCSNDNLTIAKAQTIAHDLSTALKELTHIDSANIYLDLLTTAAGTTSTPTPVVAAPPTSTIKTTTTL